MYIFKILKHLFFRGGKMKHQLLIKATVILALTLPSLSQAKVNKILQITAQSMPSLVSQINIEMTDQGSATSLFYIPDLKNQTERKYPIQNLTTNKVPLLTKSSIPVVSMKLDRINASGYIVNIIYLYQFKLLGSEYRIKKLQAQFSVPDNRYRVIDLNTKKEISRLHFLSHYSSFGQEVGIEKIETL